jgi:hypothetical protein
VQMARLVLIVGILVAAILPFAAHAQVATPAPAFGVADAISPVKLYERLLTTPFPNDLIPPGVAPLEPYEWRDSNDPDLAGAVGGVLFADGDPFSSTLPTAIAYMVYPDADGPRAPLATASQLGQPAEFLIDGQSVPAVRAELEGVVGFFTVVDNVFVYGMASTSEDADQLAVALVEAGVAHLRAVATEHAATATPVAGATQDGQDPFLALAGSPFPTADLPFDVGSLVVLPMTVTPQEADGRLQNALLVRDADRTYPYPLVIYRFYADEAAAIDAISATVRLAGTPAVGELPPEIEIPYPTTLLDHTNDTTEVLVQVGAKIVIGNAPRGNPAERHEAAMRLAQIGVRHLEEVAGSGTTKAD